MYKTSGKSSSRSKCFFSNKPWGIIKTVKEIARKEGLEKGLEISLRKSEQNLHAKEKTVVINLIQKLGLSDKEVATITDVSIAFVQNVRKELENS